MRRYWETEHLISVMEEAEILPEFQEQALGGSFQEAFGLVETYLDSLINDEDWDIWKTFHAKPGTVLPWATADRLVYKVTPWGTEAAPTPTQAPSWMAEVRPPTPGRVGAAWIRESYGSLDKRKLIILHANRLEVFRDKSSQWDPLWLFTDSENLYVQRPWNWEEVLPRMTTVAGVLLAGILLVELIRMLLGVGRRRKEDQT